MKHLRAVYMVWPAQGLWSWAVVVEVDSHPNTWVVESTWSSKYTAMEEIQRQMAAGKV